MGHNHTFQTPNIVGLILAGGASQRMGTDKTCLILNKETLLNRSLRLLKQLSLTEVFISGPQKGAIPDSLPLQGPAHAILNVMKTAAIPSIATHLLVIPVDMPLLSQDLLCELINSVKQPTNSSFFESFPLPAIISISALNHINVPIESNLSIRQLLYMTQAHPKNIPSFNHYQLMNANTPAQWQACKQTLSLCSTID